MPISGLGLPTLVTATVRIPQLQIPAQMILICSKLSLKPNITAQEWRWKKLI